jgi:RNA polymerase sigma-70 factor (sigma-E family)
MGRTPPEGFTEFVVARSGELQRTAYLLTHNRASAEDLVQTALVKAWRAWDRVRSDREAYVRRIVVNEFATGWRRRWRGERPTEELPNLGTQGFEDATLTHQSLIRALATLPPRQRAVIVLRFFHDYTEARTAEELGVSVGTVKSQTAKALATLRVRPEMDGIEQSQPAPTRMRGQLS